MKTKIIISFICLILFNSCKSDFLDDKAYSVITQDNFYKTANDAITAVNGVYKALTGAGMYHAELLYLNEYPTECVTTRLSIGESNARWDSWNYQIGDFGNIYSAQYKLIERANQVIANVPKCDMLESLKTRVIGEATFLRSLAYFNLVRVYGRVPLKITPTTDFSNLAFPQATEAQIYSQIISDLIWVYESANLPKTSSYGASDKGRVGRSAVQALLGKVYLTRASDPLVAQTGDYQKAIDVLNACVTEADRSLVPNYADVFNMTKENNVETIFDIQHVRKSGMGGNLTSFLPTNVTTELYQISYYDFPASVDFYKSFEAGDQRRSVTFYDRMKVKIGTTSNVEVYYDPNSDPNIGSWRRVDDNTQVSRSVIPAAAPGFRKFVDTDLTARQNSEEPNYYIIRYSDVLLMLAEAINEVNNGPTTDAYNYINMVRRRAFGKPVNTADATVDYTGLNKEDFRKAIYSERRKEFVIESQNWFDGKRFWDLFTQAVSQESVGANPNINNRPKELIDLNRINQDKYKLMPFSESQLDLNKELVQNQGYN